MALKCAVALNVWRPSCLSKLSPYCPCSLLGGPSLTLPVTEALSYGDPTIKRGKTHSCVAALTWSSLPPSWTANSSALKQHLTNGTGHYLNYSQHVYNAKYIWPKNSVSKQHACGWIISEHTGDIWLTFPLPCERVGHSLSMRIDTRESPSLPFKYHSDYSPAIVSLVEKSNLVATISP